MIRKILEPNVGNIPWKMLIMFLKVNQGFGIKVKLLTRTLDSRSTIKSIEDVTNKIQKILLIVTQQKDVMDVPSYQDLILSYSVHTN
eukprot:snap_masked-scaffold_7-processed-gene-0.9-mRNA-1 protein AED:1.00 eAED:1.00 QI:0/0/0/0/1/1/2/0/86